MKHPERRWKLNAKQQEILLYDYLAFHKVPKFSAIALVAARNSYKKERALADKLARALSPMEIIADDHFAAGQVRRAKLALKHYRLARGGKGK